MDEGLVFREDWSLHPKGHLDRRRHDARVREAIRERLPDLLHDESFFLSDGKAIVRIPVRTLEEARFRFDEGKHRHVGQGAGGTRPGDVVGRAADGATPDGGPGEAPGVDYIEAEVTLEAVEEVLFSELTLPNLRPKAPEAVSSDGERFSDLRKKGAWANLDKRRTVFQALKRTRLRAALAGPEKGGGVGAERGRVALRLTDEDLRFRAYAPAPHEEGRAVVFAMMDTSGSMGTYEKEMARTFFFWMTRFLKTRFERVDRVYIAHHAEAKVVDEETFFRKGESGGTVVSSAYALALRLIAAEYPPERYNLYAIHFTDGDNLPQDNAEASRLLKALIERTNLTGYAEVTHYAKRRTLYDEFLPLASPAFRLVRLQDKSDLYGALRHFFSERTA
ncbi:YeaH/YhbH family protein [Hydrogenibacillus schlegelii]|uniref:Uncharacterized protein n=1 Tax=Hydrogenibacillus schlegelii TaxID=1484 RepID=A0A132N5X5_HYDSH|nr:DUF444 family protein [Hydrogenibacillus schlegelii]KWX05397.1 hypothetical protein TR75_07725 [Hydrogenibacillus schlegelii]OAR03298.1 hypothetical protein SA87_03830 [Hydrogenibacillus schlegelii]